MVIDLRGRYKIAVAWPRSRMMKSRVDAIAIHHSVTPTPAADWTIAQEIAVLDAIHRHHLAQGFGGIGYHLCGFPSGRWYLTAPLEQWGANVGGENNHVYGVCIIGTYTEVAPIIEALQAGAMSVDEIDRFLGREVVLRSHGKIYGGWTATTCPGKVSATVSSLRGLIPTPPEEEDDVPMTQEEFDEKAMNWWLRITGIAYRGGLAQIKLDMEAGEKARREAAEKLGQ